MWLGARADDQIRVDLLSGVKGEDEISNSPNAHFVIGKDYYTVTKNPLGNPPLIYENIGSLTAISGQNFPALGGAAIGQLIIQPNSIRAPHWHLNFAEAGYCYQGLGQVGTIVPGGTIPKAPPEESQGFFREKRVEEIFVQPNEIFFFPEGSQHYLRNVGTEPFACALFFNEGSVLNPDALLTITLQNIVGNTPQEVLRPILATDQNGGDKPYTAQTVAEAPPQGLFINPARA